MIVAVGDLQGCACAFDRLAAAVAAKADTQWWFCGDLVNRGPDSLGALRRLRALGDRAVTVLGNHDLHLLAVACGARARGASDTLDAILAAPDRDELLDWLRQRPLAHFAHGHLLVHAGVLPGWTVEGTLALAGEIETSLRGPGWREFLVRLFEGRSPRRWDDGLAGPERWRVITNALTRLRFCSAEGVMELKSTAGPDQGPSGYLPWFEAPGRRSAGTPIVFGHWAALGLKQAPDLIGLDTGCVWGGRLTAVSLHADWRRRRIWQVECERSAAVGE